MTTLNLTKRQITILGIALTNLYDEISKFGEGQQMKNDIMEYSYYLPPVMMKLSNAKCFKEFHTQVHYNFS